jgi:hypothetical protein
VGREAAQRTTLYAAAALERRHAGREAAPLAPVIQTPARRVANVGGLRPATTGVLQP